MMGLALALPSRAQDLPQDYVNAHNAARAQALRREPCGSSGNLSGADGLWVSEKDDYDYNSNSCNAGKVCGHYTHVVWRNSVRIGCAKVRCNNGGTFIGCNYASPGDVVGQKPY
ncbi:Pathogenesis-related protein 1 [Citrus sinensis]|nr:Pathogenesis-related protein 1 [Citrus sinensis]